MKNVLKKANLKADPAIITAATDEKSMSGKRAGHLFWAVVLFGFGLACVWLALQSIVSVFVYSSGWVSIIFLVIIFLVCSFFAYLLIGMSFYAVKGESNWVLVLYEGRVRYFYRQEIKDKELTELELPIAYIKKCHLLRKRVKRWIKGKVFAEYHLSVHLEYADDETDGYTNLTQPDSFAEVNYIVSFLQNEKHIPVYFNVVEPEGLENLDEVNIGNGRIGKNRLSRKLRSVRQKEPPFQRVK